ncbi:MAG: sigma-70 family RNA polymerase sigma factor [Polyangiaceae bacterium]|nr:sigma-70 family RNA polymerase sigma factor [Polyangiaceae bacterium]
MPLPDRAEPDDTELLSAARDGDEAALERLLERHQERIFRFGMRMCKHEEDARDVVQETLLALARGVRDFRGESSLATWLYAVARSHCIKKRRVSKFAPPVEAASMEEVAQVAAPGAAPDDEVETRRALEELERALGELEPEHREVLLLRDVEGLTAPEVAHVVGISVEAVKSRLHRARGALRARLTAGPRAPALPAASPCPDIAELYSRHLEGDIGPDACAELERHVAACPRCKGVCTGLERSLRLCRSAPRIPVPPAIQRSIRVALRDLLRPTSP